MNKIKSLLTVVKIVLKYGVVVMAVIKGITVIVEEIEKIDMIKTEPEAEPSNEETEFDKNFKE